MVTCTACLANPARFHTSEPSLGSNRGTSRLTSLYVAGLPLYGWRTASLQMSQVRDVAAS